MHSQRIATTKYAWLPHTDYSIPLMLLGDQRRVVLRGKTPQYINATFVDVSNCGAAWSSVMYVLFVLIGISTEERIHHHTEPNGVNSG